MPQKTLSLRKDVPLLSLVSTLFVSVFSYHPLIALGSLSGVHIELSLIYILVLGVTVLSLSLIWQNVSVIFRNPLSIALLGFVVFVAISTLWTPNPIRGVITASFFVLMTAFAFVISLQYKALARHKKTIIRLLMVAYLLALLCAVWQIVGDLLKISPAYTLLPQMYSGNVFGIARPTGFALEPQFFASLLLIPLLYGVYLALTGKQSRYGALMLFALSTFFFLTLSRGAYLGLAVALVVLLIAYHTHWQRLVASLLPLFLGLAMMLLVVFLGAEVRQDNITGYSALRRTISHISLGVISLPKEQSAPQTTSGQTTDTKISKKSDGYVKSSTDSRLSMSQQAIKQWLKNPKNFLFGIGIGGFGASLSPPQPSAIVNNYYLELLTETGIIGFGLLATFFGILGIKLLRYKAWFILALLAGLLTQALFFSGNANIVHIWMVLGLAIGIVMRKELQRISPSRLVQ